MKTPALVLSVLTALVSVSCVQHNPGQSSPAATSPSAVLDLQPSALSLAAFGYTAGSASALLGAIQMTIGACTSALVSVLQDHTALPMTGVMACCAICALSVFSFGRKIITQRASKEIVEEEDVEMISTL